MFAFEIKIGDAGACKNGMISSLYFPEQWGHTTRAQVMAHFSKAGKVYQPVIVDDVYRPLFLDMVRGLNTNNVRDAKFRACKYAFDLDAIAILLGDSGYRDKLRSTDIVPVLDWRGMPDLNRLLKDTSLIDYNAIREKDFNAISSGSHNIGSGETYTTCAGFWNDWDTALTGNITGLLTSNVTDTTTVYLGYNHSHSGYTSNLNSNSSHAGSPVGGRQVSVTSSDHFVTLYESGGSGVMTWDGVRLTRTGNANSANSKIFDIDASVSMTNVNIQNCFFDGGGYTGSLLGTSGTLALNINRCVVWDASAAGGVGWLLKSGTGTKTVKNCHFYNSVTNIDCNGVAATITNVASGAGTTPWANIGSATVTYSASTGTLAGGTNQQNLTWADQFELTDSSSNFTEPKAAGVCDTSGTNPSDFTTDIAGNDISSVFPIGAKRIPAAAGGNGLRAGTLSLMGVGI